MDRVILHSDLNSFYASVECFYHPELRPFPVAVSGNAELRHGIILAKNQLAKSSGVKTGEAIWQARQKCPNLICVNPNYELYTKHSQLARKIYTDYSDRVESFGPDECWIDISGSVGGLANGKPIADEIRGRIKYELGITASVGVSFCKVFAKLGSDLKKPDATTVISREDFREKVWPLEASEMIYIGRATNEKLLRYGIHTIGELAQTEVGILRSLLGKNGAVLWSWANGRDYSEVRQYEKYPPVKSIGNSTTAPRDIVHEDELKITLHLLCESVASRLRDHGCRCQTVQISIRDATLFSYERQAPLAYPASDSESIYSIAIKLFSYHRLSEKPVRSLGIRACNLVRDTVTQLCLYPEVQKMQRQEELERAMDGLRNRYGFHSIKRGLMLTDNEMSALDAKGEHTIYPESFFH
ncbi:MAG: DNA polymerase IV [Oscillospiraceae bacterium]